MKSKMGNFNKERYRRKSFWGWKSNFDGEEGKWGLKQFKVSNEILDLLNVKAILYEKMNA
jgi:hypothetical protein